MPVNVWTSLINVFQKTGIYEFGLPFILTFAISYALLDKIKIFSDTKINTIIALIISFFVIAYTPLGTLGPFLTRFFGQTTLILIGMLGITMALGRVLEDLVKKKWKGYLSIPAGLIVAFLFISSGALELLGFKGGGAPSVSRFTTEDWIAIGFGLFVLVSILWISGKERGNEEGEREG